MTHEHDMQPVGPKLTTGVPDGALSLNATFAEAILASKRHLDVCAAIVEDAQPEGGQGLRIVAEMRVRLGTGYAMLAQALQHGAPGQRF